MVVYEIDGFRVYTDMGWFYPEYFDVEWQEFRPFTGKDGWEVQFQTEAQAIDYLLSK